MGAHSDDEKSLVSLPDSKPVIATLSLGDERTMEFQTFRGEKVSQVLESGSLLLMCEETQKWSTHKLLKGKGPRVSFTFRLLAVESK